MTENRLVAILVRLRDEHAPIVSMETIRRVAEVEVRNQYDDDREPTRSQLRKLVGTDVEARLTKEDDV